MSKRAVLYRAKWERTRWVYRFPDEAAAYQNAKPLGGVSTKTKLLDRFIYALHCR